MPKIDTSSAPVIELHPTQAEQIDSWEAEVRSHGEFFGGSSAPEAWAAQFVHVMRDFPAPASPIETGGIDVYQLLLFESDNDFVERYAGRAPHVEGPVSRGSLNLVPPELNAGSCATHWRGLSSAVSVMLPSAALDRAARDLDVDPLALRYDVRYCHDDALVTSCVRELAREVTAGGPGGRIYGEQLIHTAALRISLRYATGPAVADAHRGGLSPRAMRRVREYVDAHLAEAVSLHDLAAVAELSTFHFARAFRQTTGQPPATYVRAARLARAREMLVDPALAHYSIAEVAAAVGYTTASAFSTAFRRAYGGAPRELRRR